MKLKYNVPIEVTEEQYRRLMKECRGVVAGQEKDGKYYIRLWIVKHKDRVEKVLGE